MPRFRRMRCGWRRGRCARRACMLGACVRPCAARWSNTESDALGSFSPLLLGVICSLGRAGCVRWAGHAYSHVGVKFSLWASTGSVGPLGCDPQVYMVNAPWKSNGALTVSLPVSVSPSASHTFFTYLYKVYVCDAMYISDAYLALWFWFLN